MTTSQTFYCLTSPLNAEHEPLYGDVDWYEKFRGAEFVEGSISYKHITCPIARKLHSRPGERVGDLKLVLHRLPVTDFIWTVMGECVITDRVLHLFEEGGFTGFQKRAASIVKVKRRRYDSNVAFPTVWEFVVMGRGGEALPESGIRLLYACSGCGLKRYSSYRNGIIVDEGQWDGTDFFTINSYNNYILVTDRVKDCIIRNKLINCAITPSHELVWPRFPDGKRLSSPGGPPGILSAESEFEPRLRFPHPLSSKGS